MKIKEIRIDNFKSISEITIPFNVYGRNKTKSATTIFVGINESGKSNILEALKLINTGFEDLEFDQICNKSNQDDISYVDIWLELEIVNQEFYRKKLIEHFPNLKELIEKVKIEYVQKNIYLNKKNESLYQYEFKLTEIRDLFKYIITKKKKTVNNVIIETNEIYNLAIENNINENITINNVRNFLEDGQKILTQTIFESECLEILEPILNANIPKVIFWEAKDNYLINDSIDLTKFKENTSISIPLKNIFRIGGKISNDEIKTAIEKALKSPSKNAELVDSLSESLTKHVNKVWKEHKINLKIHINGNMCSVHVEDKSKKHEYYRMNERSDGFKQFVSLILSLSAETESNTLKNNLIILDEPEVHLHPSGIRFMRDELLKIGKKNNVFISTHSHYMIDTKTMERHWIVQKENDTEIHQLTETDNIKDEEVVSKAFGLDLMKELLPGNILLVEGLADKKVINHLIQCLDNTINYSIKHAGGCPKVYSIASLMSDEGISAIIIVDDDQEGKNTRSEIQKKLKNSFNNESVLTLRDILGTLPNNSSIEDILPIDLVKSLFFNEFGKDLIVQEGKPIITLISSQEESLRGKENKEKLQNFKNLLCNKFLEKYPTLISLKKSQSFCLEFTDSLLKIIKNKN